MNPLIDASERTGLKRRNDLQRLVRKHGAKTVAAQFGLAPSTLTSLIAYASKAHPQTLAAVALGFEQLGPCLGLEPELELPSREITPRRTK